MPSWRVQKISRNSGFTWRMNLLLALFLFFVFVIALRLFILQVLEHSYYSALASGQHDLFRELIPERGEILVRDYKEGKEYPAVSNQQLGFVYAVPRLIDDPKATAEKLGEILGMDFNRPEVEPVNSEQGTVNSEQGAGSGNQEASGEVQGDQDDENIQPLSEVELLEERLSKENDNAQSERRSAC